MSVRVKVKATGIIRTITEANYQLSKHKYELLDAPEETPKQAPQVKNEAAEPVEKEQQHKISATAYVNGEKLTGDLDLSSIDMSSSPTEKTGDDRQITFESTGITEEQAAELAPLLTKKRPGRKPKQS
jgi:hypothetical protein